MKLRDFMFFGVMLLSLVVIFGFFRSNKWSSIIDHVSKKSQKPIPQDNTHTYDKQPDDISFENPTIGEYGSNQDGITTGKNQATSSHNYDKKNINGDVEQATEDKTITINNDTSIKVAKDLLKEIKGIKESDDFKKQGEKSRKLMQIVLDDLVDKMNESSDVFNEVVKDFKRTTDAGMLNYLAAAIGRTRRPEAVDFAISSLESNISKQHTIAVLHVLDYQDSHKAVKPLTDFIKQSDDPEIVAEAIYALPEPKGMSKSNSSVVASTLQDLLYSKNKEVRFRAALELGKYTTDQSEIDGLKDLMVNDPSPRVRAAAACSFMYQKADESILDELIGIISDPSEVMLVRQCAYRSMRNQGPLKDEHAVVIQKYNYIVD